jgi:hypothetical protein
MREKKPAASADADTDASFEIWWKQYPKKADKQDALKAYRAVIKKKLATPDQLLSAVMRYAADRSREDPKYTKNPATWLNKGSWANEPAPIGDVIDQNGNPVATPPPNQQRPPPYQRESTTERMLRKLGGQANG